MHPLNPPGLTAPAGLLASLAADLTLVAYFVVAELFVVFSTWAWSALELYSRSRLLELATEEGKEAWMESRLERTAVYELAVRITRFIGNALLVAGIAFLALREHLSGATSSVGFPWGPLGVTLGFTFLVSFVLNDLLIRLVSKRNPDRFLLSAIPYLDWLAILTAPIRIPLSLLVRLFFRVNLQEPAPSAREEVLESVEEGEREGSLTPHEADMIESIIDLSKSTIDDVLTPRGEIDMIRVDATLVDAVKDVLESGHQRLPVYGKDRDDVVGVIHAYDLLREMSESRPREQVKLLMRSPFFVPEGKRLPDLLNEMRGRRASMAIVMNDYGGTAGLVTIADVLEEIVGEIEDEHDHEEEPPPTPGVDGSIEVEGRTPVDELNETLPVKLPEDDDVETIGGIVFHAIGKVPAAGDSVTVGRLRLEVTEADERTVKSVRIHVLGEGEG